MPIGSDQTIAVPVVLLTGASSQIGVFIIPRLLEAGFRVIAVSRHGRPSSYPELESVQWMDELMAMKVVPDCQFLVSAGPMELAGKFLAAGQRFQSVCVFSSSSVESKIQSANPVERTQIQAMLRLETKLQALSKDRGFRLVILRPTLIYGCGMDVNISRLARWIARFGFMPVNGQAVGLRQPVHADDLASLAVTALTTTRDLPPILVLAGGETLSYSEMVERVFAAMEKPVRILRLPEWFFVLLVKAVGLLRPDGGMNGEMVRRQRTDLVFDDHIARQLLDYKPRSFSPDSGDFSLPTHPSGDSYL